jgi:Ala-tRNA(Pro) deacylase
MAIAKNLERYLKEHRVGYELIVHHHTGSSMETAQSAHVSGDSLAKGVVLKDKDEYLLVVIPSDYHVELERLNELLKGEWQMANESDLEELFPDCEVGAVPALGYVYSINTVWDPSSSLGNVNEVFFEAGDHRELICVTGEVFHELMAQADRVEMSHHI